MEGNELEFPFTTLHETREGREGVSYRPSEREGEPKSARRSLAESREGEADPLGDVRSSRPGKQQSDSSKSTSVPPSPTSAGSLLEGDTHLVALEHSRSGGVGLPLDRRREC